MSNTDDSSLLIRVKERLTALFQQPLIKKSVNVLVPGILATILFPVFGPAVAAVPAALSIHQGLKLLGISFSEETIGKILKPLQGKSFDESDLLDVLDNILQEDKQVNGEAAKALVTVLPTVKDAAMANSKLDGEWLSENLSRNLKDQGTVMAQIAPDVRALLSKDGNELNIAVQEFLQKWSHITVEVIATHRSEISDVESTAKASGGMVSHRVVSEDSSKVQGIKMNSEIL